MGDAKRTYFAVRVDEGAGTKWVTVGQTVGGFTVAAYDAAAESLTLRNPAQTLVLKMPAARVIMAVDEITVGLSKILNIPDANGRRDLLHPKLRPLFKDSDLQAGFEHFLESGAVNELQPITDEESKALDEGLAAVEKIVGARPAYGLWTKRGNGSRAMSFVVQVGDAWYLAPGVPEAGGK